MMATSEQMEQVIAMLREMLDLMKLKYTEQRPPVLKVKRPKDASL